MSELAFQVRFGPVRARIEVDERLASIHATLERWLSPERASAGGTTDVVFRLGPAGSGPPAEPSPRVHAGSASAAHGRVTMWDGRAWEATTGARTAGAAAEWDLARRDGTMLRTLGRLPTPLFRFLHVHRFTPMDVRASTFLYRHLIPAVQSALLEHDATFVHASALRAPDGRGLLLSGWGGAGKTSASAALYLGKPDRWRFMSDDLAILDAGGQLHLSPIPLNVFPYSTRHFPPLHDQVVRPMGGVDRLQWAVRGRLMGRAGVARRIPPPSAPPEQAMADLRLAVHLQRVGGGPAVVHRCDATRLASVCGSILLYELRAALPMYSAASAFCLPGPAPVPGPADLAVGAERVLRRALHGARTACIDVPESMTVEQIGERVEDLWSDTQEA